MFKRHIFSLLERVVPPFMLVEYGVVAKKKNMNIVYVANVRIPTYRAHGIQITKMCEEFARLGNTVRLAYFLKTPYH